MKDKPILYLYHPSALQCVHELWDKGRLFNDTETLERFQKAWRLRLCLHSSEREGYFEFDTEQDLAWFLLKFSS